MVYLARGCTQPSPGIERQTLMKASRSPLSLREVSSLEKAGPEQCVAVREQVCP